MKINHRIFDMGDYSVIEIRNRRQGKYFYVLVDSEDVERIENFASRLLVRSIPGACTNYCWIRSKDGYDTQYLHRFLMNTPKGLVVDHINHNGMDNRKKNLRNCTQKENLANRRYPSHIFNQGVKQA